MGVVKSQTFEDGMLLDVINVLLGGRV